MPNRLDEETILEELNTLTRWQREGDSIVRDVACRDFRSALALLNAVGDLAERADHHPDLLLHSWNKVRIVLTTHSAGGLTENDFALAREIEKLLSKLDNK